MGNDAGLSDLYGKINLQEIRGRISSDSKTCVGKYGYRPGEKIEGFMCACAFMELVGAYEDTPQSNLTWRPRAGGIFGLSRSADGIPIEINFSHKKPQRYGKIVAMAAPILGGPYNFYDHCPFRSLRKEGFPTTSQLQDKPVLLPFKLQCSAKCPNHCWSYPLAI